MNSCIHNLRLGHVYYQNLVNRITNLVGMTHTIDVYESDTANACATTLLKACSPEQHKPLIAYNPNFINTLTHWATIAVFAHEVAHHYNKDLYGNYKARFYAGMGILIDKKSHRQELNADRFAGFVLRYEGANYLQATELINYLDVNDSNSHPGAFSRMLAMQAGWRQADNKIKAAIRKANFQYHGWGEFLLGIGAIALVGAGVSAFMNEE